MTTALTLKTIAFNVAALKLDGARAAAKMLQDALNRVRVEMPKAEKGGELEMFADTLQAQVEALTPALIEAEHRVAQAEHEFHVAGQEMNRVSREAHEAWKSRQPAKYTWPEALI